MVRSTKLKPLHFWCAALPAFWLLQAFTLGISDDEAYYWVLSRIPALGYAYHPPMVAWAIALTEWLTQWMDWLPHAGRTRLSAIFFSVCFWGLGALWVRRVLRETQDREPGHLDLGWLIIPGLAGAGWMVVPDLPLFAGWMLCFAGVYEACLGRQSGWARLAISGGAALGMLSKFSGALFVGSAAASILLWAPVDRRRSLCIWLLMGALLSVIPTVIWNSAHDWASLRYQFLERHRSGGAWEPARHLRFAASQLLLAGPALMVFAARLAISAKAGAGVRHAAFAAVWALPACAVFWLQPGFSDFKAHWALVAWWPIALAAATAAGRARWLDRLQLGWALSIILLFTALTQSPLQARITRWWTGSPGDPRWDVTNDLTGWSGLSEFVRERLGDEALRLPVLGSRYQTASQAAFALGSSGTLALVSLFPKNPAERAEWPTLDGIIDEAPSGSHDVWPAPLQPLLFVADNRYSAPPRFPNGSCDPLGVLRTLREEFVAREVKIWKCSPPRQVPRR